MKREDFLELVDLIAIIILIVGGAAGTAFTIAVNPQIINFFVENFDYILIISIIVSAVYLFLRSKLENNY